MFHITETTDDLFKGTVLDPNVTPFRPGGTLVLGGGFVFEIQERIDITGGPIVLANPNYVIRIEEF